MNSRLILLIAALGLACACGAQAQQKPVAAKKPNILVIFGDDIGVANVSAYSHGLVGYRTPNIELVLMQWAAPPGPDAIAARMRWRDRRLAALRAHQRAQPTG